MHSLIYHIRYPNKTRGIDLYFCRWQKLLCCRHRAGVKQQSTGLLYLDRSIPQATKKKDHPKGWSFFLATVDNNDTVS